LRAQGEKVQVLGINQLRPFAASLMVLRDEFKVPHARKVCLSAVNAAMWAISVLCLLPMELFAWTNGPAFGLDGQRTSARRQGDRRKVRERFSESRSRSKHRQI
jgi:hypothetical protein